MKVSGNVTPPAQPHTGNGGQSGENATPEQREAQQKLSKTAYGLFLRGMTVADIAAQIQADEGQVASWCAERASRGRGATPDMLELLKRHLFSRLEGASDRDRPAFVNALVSIESKLLQLSGRCGARYQDDSGRFCKRLPEKGRTRCREHGGLTPVGEDSPQFVDGHRSKYPVPLDPDEVVRYEDYLAKAYTVEVPLALMKVQLERAIKDGRPGTVEAGAVAKLAAVHTQITKGTIIRVVPDEAIVSRLAELMMGTVEKVVLEVLEASVGKTVLGRIAIGLRDIDWAIATQETIAIPASTDSKKDGDANLDGPKAHGAGSAIQVPVMTTA